MAQFIRTKKLTNNAYSPTIAVSEAAIRAQVDGSVQEVSDILFSTDAGKGASQIGINASGYADLQAFVVAVEASGTGTLPPANSVTENMMVAAMKKVAGGVAPYDDVMFESGGTLEDYSEKLTTNATATGTVSIDLSLGNVFDITLTGTTTFTFDNPSISGKTCSFTMFLRQGGTAQTVTWPASVKWSNDSIPVISDINKTCIFSFVTINGGTRWYGTSVTKLTT